MIRAFVLLFSVAVGSALNVAAEPASEGQSDGQLAEVAMLDGRVLTGVVDARTDADALWLRLDEDRISMAVAASWREVASVTIQDATFGGEAFKAEARRYATPGIMSLATEVELPTADQMALSETSAFYNAKRPARQVRVRNLEIVSVRLANLDRDVEPDGLEVTIAAIGDDGLPVAVRGSLSAELIAQRQPAQKAEVTFNTIGRWTERVASEDFVDGMAVYNLPFRRAAPERQFDLLPDALLTIRLGAHGHGNYAASAPVLLRKFNPLRDNLQQLEDTRFLPQEIQGRSPVNRLHSPDGLWLHWMR